MREYEVPASYVVPEDASMSDSVFTHAEESPELVVFQIADGNGGWSDITAKAFAESVTAVAKGLIASGIEIGDRVALMAPTRYEWTLLDYAIWAVGGCTVAIYDSSSAEQAKWILADSGTTLLIIDNERHLAAISDIRDSLPQLREILLIDAGQDNNAVAELTTRGAGLDDARVHERRAAINAASPGTLIYTSGTTGRPKGVILTHANLCGEVETVRAAMRGLIERGQRTLMFLPLAHVFARALTVSCFEIGVTTTFSSDWSTLVDQFAAFRPDFVISVPRVFEKVFNSAKQKAHDGGKGSIFDAATDTAIAWSQAIENGGPSLVLRIKHAVFDRLVYSKLRAALGGNCGAAISGGGPLGARLGHFFRGAGVPIYEGYGLTETTAAVACNLPSGQRVGSVGRPLEGHAARIAEDGELLIRGTAVFQRYWHNDNATADAFEDGWFKTGDLGAIDEDGFITITGRKKEIIVTAGGKNVSPAIMEDSLRLHVLISQAMVVGDAKPFIGALITLDPEALQGWKERQGMAADTPIEEVITNPQLVAEIDAAVAETNKLVSHAEAIKKIRILPVDWTQEGGELTPKLSLKRAVVLEQYANEVDKLYG